MVVNVNVESTKVTSFNGRTGPVKPQKGDYTADMVGAVTLEEVSTAFSDKVSAGTTDLTEGVSQGTPGTFYFVYKRSITAGS